MLPCALLALALTAARAEEPVQFNRDIRPILNAQCFKCHGGVKEAGGLNLQFRDRALQAGETGEVAIVPGHPEKSAFIERITTDDKEDRMPRKGPGLSKEQVAMFKRWIAEGAPWEKHWAYIPPKPNGKSIDQTVGDRLAEKKLTLAPAADVATLARRLSLDLIGLPPEPARVTALEAAVKASGETGWNAFIDELLASPAYGERWAVPWLDLARYADSRGYEKDGLRDMWRYRDWVIDSLNADMPYDRFVTEQLAGDLLPKATDEQIVATAFHRNTLQNDEGGTDDEEFRTLAVIDRTNTTFDALQGTSIGCVQCHGHPYDAFVHHEYYELYAFFNQTADADRGDGSPTRKFFARADAEKAAPLRKSVDELQAKITAQENLPENKKALTEWLAEMSATPSEESKDAFLQKLAALPKPIRDLLAKDQKKWTKPERTTVERHFYGALGQGFTELYKELDAVSAELAKVPVCDLPIMQELAPPAARKTQIFERGNWMVKGAEVHPQTPQNLNPWHDDYPKNRLGFAQWLTNGENPLTARVQVNRVWEQLFGVGLVETLEDFGSQGDFPIYQDLLDDLAVRFQGEMKWSQKALLREIVRSRVYRQTSKATKAQIERDPANRLLARGARFRLSNEQIHDQALAIGGVLSRKMAGPPVMPYQPPGIWMTPYDGAQWKTSAGEDSRRRALYTLIRRSAAYPSMVTFDAPNRETCSVRRIRTNTPLQSLDLMNSPVYMEAAAGLAKRMAEPGGSLEEQIQRGLSFALLRPARPAEVAVLRALHAQVGGNLTLVANSILNLDEVLTKN
ncbi:MAG TPA: PSD1 and planctomycete cytochrome C domain-containing protein [Chthoniobacteraceae bacterium]|jgi:hypothetical protein|nr:PSD1 and planctomycete cytochrome C domain-containing protein [Chthoniobacteraceae bacterium]